MGIGGLRRVAPPLEGSAMGRELRTGRTDDARGGRPVHEGRAGGLPGDQNRQAFLDACASIEKTYTENARGRTIRASCRGVGRGRSLFAAAAARRLRVSQGVRRGGSRSSATRRTGREQEAGRRSGIVQLQPDLSTGSEGTAENAKTAEKTFLSALCDLGRFSLSSRPAFHLCQGGPELAGQDSRTPIGSEGTAANAKTAEKTILSALCYLGVFFFVVSASVSSRWSRRCARLALGVCGPVHRAGRFHRHGVHGRMRR
jgi:hypothetical protein